MYHFVSCIIDSEHVHTIHRWYQTFNFNKNRWHVKHFWVTGESLTSRTVQAKNNICSEKCMQASVVHTIISTWNTSPETNCSHLCESHWIAQWNKQTANCFAPGWQFKSPLTRTNKTQYRLNNRKLQRKPPFQL